MYDWEAVGRTHTDHSNPGMPSQSSNVRTTSPISNAPNRDTCGGVDSDALARSFFTNAAFMRRITELQLESVRRRKENESLRFRNVPPVAIDRNFPGVDKTRLSSPWLDTQRDTDLNSQIRSLENKNKQMSEELDQRQIAEESLERQLDLKRRELEDSLKQQSTIKSENVVLRERNQLLRMQLETAKEDRSKVEVNARALMEKERRELEQIREKQEKVRHDLEIREEKLSAERERLRNENEAAARKKKEAEAVKVKYAELISEVEKEKQELEMRELNLNEDENRLSRWRDELNTFNSELEDERLRVESELEAGRKRLNDDVETRMSKLKQQEAELGRTSHELNQRQLEIEGLKKELQQERHRLKEQTSDTHQMRTRSAGLEASSDVDYWKKRAETAEAVEKTLAQQLKMMQTITDNAANPPQGKRKGLNIKSRDVGYLTELLKDEENRKKAAAPETRRGRKVRDSEDSLSAAETAPRTGSAGSRKGTRRRATPDTPCDENSSSPVVDGISISSPSKRRRQDLNNTANKKVTDKSQVLSSSKKPPRPRNRMAAESPDPHA